MAKLAPAVPARTFECMEGATLAVHPGDVRSWTRHPDYTRDRPLTTITCYDGSTRTVVCDFHDLHHWALRSSGGGVEVPFYPVTGAQKAR